MTKSYEEWAVSNKFKPLIVTIGLTWLIDVNKTISYASRAFALYYFLQCLVASATARRVKEVKLPNQKSIAYLAIAAICLVIFLFGIPSE